MTRYWLPWLVGMPAEVSLAICSLIFGGVLERLPALRIAFAHGGGAFPATIGRIVRGFEARPDLCAVSNDVSPREYLRRIYVDSLVHDPLMLRYLVDLMGPDRIALGSDYPFPLGEARPGELIDSCGFPEKTRARLLHGTALEWLDLPAARFGGARPGSPVNEPFQPGRDFAVALDRGDPLGRFRDEFHIPRSENGEEEIYFVGNSLGLLPRRTPKYVDEELEKWKRLAVKAHFSGENPWMPYHELLAEPMARLVGASASTSEVVTMNSLTVNLHLMMASFYRPTRERHRILLEEHAFPSDDYAVESQAVVHGFDPAEALVRLRPGARESTRSTPRTSPRSSNATVSRSPWSCFRESSTTRARHSRSRRSRDSRTRRGASSASTWRTRRETWSCASTTGTWTSPCGARTST